MGRRDQTTEAHAARALATLLGDAEADRPRAQALLRRCNGLLGLRELEAFELRELGLSEPEAARLHAAMRLGLLLVAPLELPEALATPAEAYAAVAPLLVGRRRERFVVVVVDVKNRPLARRVVACGTLDSCPVDPREVFRFAISRDGAGVVVAHNHPSGDPTPSSLDVTLTSRLLEAGRLLGLPLVDHLIVGKKLPGQERPPYLSMAEAGYLEALRRIPTGKRRSRRNRVVRHAGPGGGEVEDDLAADT